MEDLLVGLEERLTSQLQRINSSHQVGLVSDPHTIVFLPEAPTLWKCDTCGRQFPEGWKPLHSKVCGRLQRKAVPAMIQAQAMADDIRARGRMRLTEAGAARRCPHTLSLLAARSGVVEGGGEIISSCRTCSPPSVASSPPPGDDDAPSAPEWDSAEDDIGSLEMPGHDVPEAGRSGRPADRDGRLADSGHVVATQGQPSQYEFQPSIPFSPGVSTRDDLSSIYGSAREGAKASLSFQAANSRDAAKHCS